MFNHRSLPVRIAATIVMVPRICSIAYHATIDATEEFVNDIRDEIEERENWIEIAVPQYAKK